MKLDFQNRCLHLAAILNRRSDRFNYPFRNMQEPIFLIGFPRSGTTIIFEAFSVHEDLAWFSNLLRKYPHLPSISLISRIASIQILRGSKQQLIPQSRIKEYIPFPDECYPVWERCCGRTFSYDYLIGQKATNEQKTSLHRTIDAVMRFHGKKRFAAKITGPGRIGFLDSLFPNALFVHIIRDPRAVVNSLLKVKFWAMSKGYNRPWWDNGLSPQDLLTLARFGHSPIALAAVQWRRVIESARLESESLPKGRYMEIKYEDFICDPHGRMEQILNHCRLACSKKVHAYMKRYSHFSDQNFKYRNELSKEDQGIINTITDDCQCKLGYR